MEIEYSSLVDDYTRNINNEMTQHVEEVLTQFLVDQGYHEAGTPPDIDAIEKKLEKEGKRLHYTVASEFDHARFVMRYKVMPYFEQI